MSKNQYSVGILILAAGVVILLGKLGVFNFIGSLFWPLVILIPGVLLHVLYFGRMLPSIVLIPGGILSTYGVLFLICNLAGWGLLQYLWPVFLLGVAVGLYEYYLFDHARPKGAQLGGLILGAISIGLLVMMLIWTWGIYLIAIALIAIGAWMSFGRRYRW